MEIEWDQSTGKLNYREERLNDDIAPEYSSSVTGDCTLATQTVVGGQAVTTRGNATTCTGLNDIPINDEACVQEDGYIEGVALIQAVLNAVPVSLVVVQDELSTQASACVLGSGGSLWIANEACTNEDCNQILICLLEGKPVAFMQVGVIAATSNFTSPFNSSIVLPVLPDGDGCNWQQSTKSVLKTSTEKVEMNTVPKEVEHYMAAQHKKPAVIQVEQTEEGVEEQKEKGFLSSEGAAQIKTCVFLPGPGVNSPETGYDVEEKDSSYWGNADLSSPCGKSQPWCVWWHAYIICTRHTDTDKDTHAYTQTHIHTCMYII